MEGKDFQLPLWAITASMIYSWLSRRPICLTSEGAPMYGLSLDEWNTCHVLRCC